MIKDVTKRYKDYVIQIRREIHANPELSMQEFETTKLIKRELEKAGIKYRSTGDVGVVAIIGDERKKGVALRGDMDALQVEEKNSVDYISTKKGVMHACGHDGHTAMLLGAALALNDIKDTIKGHVKLYFQPGEEIVQGALMMLEKEPLTNIVSSFGIHLWNDIPVGKISVDAGPRMAAADIFEIEIDGKGGHGSLPNQGIDAVVVASALVMNLQSIVSRELNPLKKSVVSIGTIESGSRFNVIASKAVLRGTTRAYDKGIRDSFEPIINRIVQGTCATYRATGKLNYTYGANACINTKEASTLAKDLVSDLYGEGAVYEFNPLTGGEDFCHFLDATGGVLAFVGSGKLEGDVYPHHHAKFNIDEGALEIGTNLYVGYAVRTLEENGE